MGNLIWEDLIDLHREPNTYYLVDGKQSYVTDLSVRAIVSTTLYLKQKLQNETGLWWVVLRDEFEFVKTDFKGDRFYRKLATKSKELIPAYSFDQLRRFVQDNHPNINHEEYLENGKFIFEFSLQYEDSAKKSWYIDKEGRVRSTGKSIYKAQAFFNGFTELTNKVASIKMGLEELF